MNGREILKQALLLLGYTNSYGEVDAQGDAELFKRGTAVVQQIFDDLQRAEHPLQFIQKPVTMDSPIEGLSMEAVRDIMPYGVAMLMAQSEGDGDNQALFADLYNRKRSSARKNASTRKNVLPGGGL